MKRKPLNIAELTGVQKDSMLSHQELLIRVALSGVVQLLDNLDPNTLPAAVVERLGLFAADLNGCVAMSNSEIDSIVASTPHRVSMPTTMTKAEIMKNDKMSGDLREAFDQIEIPDGQAGGRRLDHALHGGLDGKPAPREHGHIDVMHFMADLIIDKVPDFDKIAATARVRVLEREQASR